MFQSAAPSPGLSRRGPVSHPPKVRAGQADLAEGVDHIAHGVLVCPDPLGDHRHPVPAGRREQHHPAPVAHRTRAAPTHDLLQPPPLLAGQSAHTDRLGHRAPSDRIGRHPTSNPHDHQPLNLCGHSTRRRPYRVLQDRSCCQCHHQGRCLPPPRSLSMSKIKYGRSSGGELVRSTGELCVGVRAVTDDAKGGVQDLPRRFRAFGQVRC